MQKHSIKLTFFSPFLTGSEKETWFLQNPARESRQYLLTSLVQTLDVAVSCHLGSFRLLKNSPAGFFVSAQKVWGSIHKPGGHDNEPGPELNLHTHQV